MSLLHQSTGKAPGFGTEDGLTRRPHLILHHFAQIRTPGGFPVVWLPTLIPELLHEINGPRASEPDAAAVLAWAEQADWRAAGGPVGGEGYTFAGRVEFAYRVVVGAVPADRIPGPTEWLCAKPSILWRHPEVAAWWDGKRIC